MTLTSNTHTPSLTQFVVSIYKFSGHRVQFFLKKPLFSLFPINQRTNGPVNAHLISGHSKSHKNKVKK